MTIGILGGTFDPPHLGHLNIALSAINTAAVNKVVFIPTATPPHKSRTDITEDFHRLKMTEIMLENYPEFSVSDLEIKRQGISYTILTLRELKTRFPEDNLRLIIGADMAQIFGSWKNATEIFELARPLIAARPGYEFAPDFGVTAPTGLPAEYCQQLKNCIFAAPLTDISSTEIRAALVAGNLAKIEEYIPPAVRSYIKENGLYR